MTKVDKKCVQNIKPDVKNIVLSMPGNKIGGFCNEHTIQNTCHFIWQSFFIIGQFN